MTVAAVMLAVVPGTAGLIFTLGNDPQPGQQNVLYNTGQTGTMVTGVTNMTDTVVDFTSITDILMTTASGQAKLTAQDQSINNVSISLANGSTFSDLIFNPFSGGTAAGPATVTVYTNDGTFPYNYPSGLGNGQNFLTITASDGTVIDSATITGPDGFTYLDQVRVSGISASVATPEPGTLLQTAGAFLVLLGLIGRGRASKPSERA